MPQTVDIILAIILFIILLPLLLILWLVSVIDCRHRGIFIQKRVGKNAVLFDIYKFETFRDGKVTQVGAMLRKFKLDELPQLFNIIKGDMAFVGPRPDLPGYYDALKGEDRILLKLRPGLTSLAAIKYIDEEKLLSHKLNAQSYNDEIIFRDKIRINKLYLREKSIMNDIKIMVKTIKIILIRKKTSL
ncbi:MAG: sugar transferase [Nonlabens sp.]